MASKTLNQSTEPSPKASMDTYDSGYGSNEPQSSKDSQDTRSHTEGVIASSRRLFKKKPKPTKLKSFDKEIPRRVQHRFYDLNELFGKALYQHLNGTGTKFNSISIKLKVLGESEESAKPWIVLMCDEKATKRTKQFFNLPNIKSEYQPRNNELFPAFEVLVCSRPPAQIAIDPSLTTGIHDSMSTALASHIVSSKWIPSDTMCGSSVRIGDASQSRIATIGGVIKIEKHDASYMLYSMTAGHVLRPKALESAKLDSTSLDEDEIVGQAIGGDEDESSDVEEFVLEEEDLDLEVLPGHSHEQQEHDFPRGEETAQSRDLWWTIGQISSSSDDDFSRDPGLDWALVTFRDPFLYRPNLLSSPHNSTEAWKVQFNPKKEYSINVDAGSRSVFLISGEGAPQRGSISTTMSYLMVSPATKFLKHYTLTMKNTSAIRPGICGSWVVNEANHEILGHVVASDFMGDAYVVPIHDTFLNIKQVQGAKSVSLPTDLDIERWVKYCTPWLNLSTKGIPTVHTTASSSALQSHPDSSPRPLLNQCLSIGKDDIADASRIQESRDPVHDIVEVPRNINMERQNVFDLVAYEFTPLEHRMKPSPPWAVVKRQSMNIESEKMRKLVNEQASAKLNTEKMLEDMDEMMRYQILQLIHDLSGAGGFHSPSLSCRTGFLNLIKDISGRIRIVDAIVISTSPHILLPVRGSEIVDLDRPGMIDRLKSVFRYPSILEKAPLLLEPASNDNSAWCKQPYAAQSNTKHRSGRSGAGLDRNEIRPSSFLSESTVISDSINEPSYPPPAPPLPYSPLAHADNPRRQYVPSNLYPGTQYNHPPALNSNSFPPRPSSGWPSSYWPTYHPPPPVHPYPPPEPRLYKPPSFERSRPNTAPSTDARRPKSVNMRDPEVIEVHEPDVELSDDSSSERDHIPSKPKMKPSKASSRHSSGIREHKRSPRSISSDEDDDVDSDSDSTDLESIFSKDSLASDDIITTNTSNESSRHNSRASDQSRRRHDPPRTSQKGNLIKIIPRSDPRDITPRSDPTRMREESLLREVIAGLHAEHKQEKRRREQKIDGEKKKVREILREKEDLPFDEEDKQTDRIQLLKSTLRTLQERSRESSQKPKRPSNSPAPSKSKPNAARAKTPN
ncbi:MAG: hypothetical protein Q9217_001488 [Psora testacea]